MIRECIIKYDDDEKKKDIHGGYPLIGPRIELIRCKDCKYDPSNAYPQEELPYWYPCKNEMRDQDWFCGYGKHK